MKVAVIGGGVAGLVAARHLADPSQNFQFTLFEQSDQLGGTWVYTDKTGTDQYGLPIHSSMYKSLRTNLPKEVMMFPDYPHSKQHVSYLSAAEVLQYLNDYADHFNIRPYVKFQHHVKRVSLCQSKWKIDVLDLVQNISRTLIFDAVIICNGHNSTPRYPSIPGQQHFKGRTIHSHEYRVAEPFRDQRVLIIGAGPSGIDMAFEVSKVSSSVTVSHHVDYIEKIGLPESVSLKPDVSRILEDGRIEFIDKSVAEVDVIAYCTGYLYTYPFLDDSCGVTVEDNYISPLYKSIININNPTMSFIGLIRHSPIFYVADLQVRVFLQTLKHPAGLPSKIEMLQELNDEITRKIDEGIRKCDYLMIGRDNEDYISQLSQLGGCSPMPRILLKIYFHGYEKIFTDFKHFRNYYYQIIDKDHFTVVDLREINSKPVQDISTRTNPIVNVTGK